jgi:hypothetical protein
MRFANPYFTIQEKMELLQRWIIVHSIIYYKLSTSIVTDADFDANCQQLVNLMRKYPHIVSKTRYAYCMQDFDGSTGFYLPDRLTEADRTILFTNAYRLEK